MAETVKLPGLGSVKKPYVYAGVGITAGILAWAYWRRSQTPATGTTATTDTTATGDYVQGSDAAGYNTVYPSVYSGLDYNQGGSDTSTRTYATNNDWAQAAEGALSDIGVSTQASATAISKILAGLTVTSEQKQWFLQAAGLIGDPPQGYPPIHTSDNGDGTPTPVGSVPGASLPGPVDLHASHVTATTADLSWLRVAGATGYHIYDRRHPHAIGTTSGVGGTHKHVHGMARHADYYFHVRPVGSDGKEGQSSNVVHVHTK